MANQTRVPKKSIDPYGRCRSASDRAQRLDDVTDTATAVTGLVTRLRIACKQVQRLVVPSPLASGQALMCLNGACPQNQ